MFPMFNPNFIQNNILFEYRGSIFLSFSIFFYLAGGLAPCEYVTAHHRAALPLVRGCAAIRSDPRTRIWIELLGAHPDRAFSHARLDGRASLSLPSLARRDP